MGYNFMVIEFQNLLTNPVHSTSTMLLNADLLRSRAVGDAK